MPNKTDAPSTLKGQAATIWLGAFNGAWSGSCKDDANQDACASKVAWSAVKTKYKQTDGKWVAKSAAEMNLDSTISAEGLVVSELTVRATLGQDERRWQLVGSTAGVKDLKGAKTTLPLFRSFIERIDAGAAMPYLSISHYSRLNGRGVAGVPSDLYIDGAHFRAKGLFASTDIGERAFKTIRSEAQTPPASPTKVSMAWWDFMHAHGAQIWVRRSLSHKCELCLDGQEPTEYLSGELEHFALTRVPVLPSTQIGLITKGLVEEGGKTITMRSDAASIIGEDLANELDALQKAATSTIDRSLIERSNKVVCRSCHNDLDWDPAEYDVPEDAVMYCTDCINNALAVTRSWAPGWNKETHLENFTRADFVVGEENKPETWRLRIAETPGKPTLDFVARAFGQIEKLTAEDRYVAPLLLKTLVRKNWTVDQVPDVIKCMYDDDWDTDSDWHPYGGAVTLAQALDYKDAQSMQDKARSLWWIAQDVIGNIIDAPVSDLPYKAQAVRGVFDELKSSMDSSALLMMSRVQRSQATQSALPIAVDGGTTDMSNNSQPTAPVTTTTPATQPVTVVPATTVQPAPTQASATPFDGLVDEFRTQLVQMSQAQMHPTVIRQQLGQLLQNVGQQALTTLENPGGTNPEVLRSMVRQETAPLYAQLSQISQQLAQMTGGAQPQQIQYAAPQIGQPVRRSLAPQTPLGTYQPQFAQPTLPQPAPNTMLPQPMIPQIGSSQVQRSGANGQQSQFRQLARQSVGLDPNG